MYIHLVTAIATKANKLEIICTFYYSCTDCMVGRAHYFRLDNIAIGIFLIPWSKIHSLLEIVCKLIKNKHQKH